MDVHIILIILFIITAYKWGDWKNWKLYYSTILFLIGGDLMYYYLFSNNRLWIAYSPNLSSKQVELLWKIMLYPSIVLLFLPWYLKCKSLKNKIVCILLWVVSFSILELGVLKLKYLSYGNGWNYCWSVVFYCFMFPILIVHHFKPLLAILLSAMFAIITLTIFNSSL